MSENWVVGITKSDVWEEVNRSGVLGSSKNQSALFKFLLDHHYSGAEPELKTREIATKVFGRDKNFSAKKDSIVRVEMHRLRANLESFNQQSDLIKIELPKSSYKFKIEADRSETPIIIPEDTKPSSNWYSQKRFLGGGLVASAAVTSFIILGALTGKNKGEDCSYTVPNLEVSSPADETDLSKYVNQVVSGTASQFKHFNSVKNVAACDSSRVPGYKLTYALYQADEGFNGSLSVTSQTSGKIVGIGDLSGTALALKSADSEFYFTLARITNDLLKPGGVVHRDASRQEWDDLDVLQEYRCLITMHDSFVSDSDEDYLEGLLCLEESYERGSAPLENLGALAASYLEQAQGNRSIDGPDPLKQAEDILDEIGDDWNQSPETTIAKIMYDSVRVDFNAQRLRETLRIAETTFPSHSLITAEVGRHLGFMLGDWEQAVKVAGRARRLISDQDNSVYLVEAAHAVLAGKKLQHWSNCLKAYSEHSKVSNLLVHACALKYMKSDWIARTSENLTEFNLMAFEERSAFMKNMGFEAELSKALSRPPEYNLYD